jgi:2-dehydro-3-deoxygluconokinase
MDFLNKEDRDFDVIGFGEVMLRLSPPNKERLALGEVFEKNAGGSELNVVSGISMLGLRTGIITKLPDNEIGSFIKNKIRYSGVSDDYIVYDDSKQQRLGIYYYENGAHPRKPSVVYDRANSSFVNIKHDEIPEDVYSKTRHFHVSGITLALDEALCEESIKLIKTFKENGVTISFDVNFRANLWDEATAKATVESIFPYIDILFVSEETCRRMLGKTGELEDIMKSFNRDYGCKIVATTKREVVSPTKHNWNSKIYCAETDTFYEEAEYKEIEVVDRIGSGDAYLSGVLFGLLKYEDAQKAVEFGNAMAAVKNTTYGDMSGSDFKDITRVINAHKNTGVQSELNR